MATGKTIQRGLSMDTDPITPQRDNGYSLSSSIVSDDALAGPEDASRRSTQELKQEAKLAEMKQKKRRPSNLKIDNLSQKSYSRSRSSKQNELDQVRSEIQSKVEDMSISKGWECRYGLISCSKSLRDSFSCSSMPSASENVMKELIHAGMLPNYIHHSSSESDISNSGSDMIHSSSTCSLKPVHSQNPAVTAYFQQLLSQQKLYGWNSKNYTPQQIQIIDQMYGGNLRPFSPWLYSNNSPPMMNQYQSQFAPGNFPPVPNSATYQQNLHNGTSSLKPVHPQTSAVVAYLQQLVGQQKIYGQNEENYTPQEIRFIEQMYGSTSPRTCGLNSQKIPPMIDQYRNFPPVLNSEQNQHNVKRSTSQTSAEIGLYTQFMLHTETGDVSVTVPSIFIDRIKGETEEDQQRYVRSYLNQMQQKEQQQAVLQNQPNYNTGTPSLRHESIIQPQNFGAAHGDTGQISGNPNQISNFDAFHLSNSSGSFHTNSSIRISSISLPSGSSGPMSSSQHLSEPGLGSNVDPNRSHPEGNIPRFSGFSLSSNNSTDSDSSFEPQAQPNLVTAGQNLVYEQRSDVDKKDKILDKTSVEKNLTFEESCYLNSTASTEKCSSLKWKVMPLNTTPKQQTKIMSVVKPVAAVSPYSPISVDDNYEDNCDNTDPKTLLETSQTVRKTVVLSKGGACSSEQTFVKQAWCERNPQPSVRLETEHLQREIPTQILTKTANSGEESVNNGNATFAMQNQSDVQRLFFSRQVTPISNEEDEISSIEMLSGPQEVALGNDPLTRIQEGGGPFTRKYYIITEVVMDVIGKSTVAVNGIYAGLEPLDTTLNSLKRKKVLSTQKSQESTTESTAKEPSAAASGTLLEEKRKRCTCDCHIEMEELKKKK